MNSHCYLCEQKIEDYAKRSTYFTPPRDDTNLLFNIVDEYTFCKYCSVVLDGLLGIVKDVRDIAKQ